MRTPVGAHLRLVAWMLALGAVLGTGSVAAAGSPSVVLISVDTLRTDFMSLYGYERETSPHLDRLLQTGGYFTAARTPAPLTAPAMCSVMTSLYPHEHGSSRNGLRMRPNLVSFASILERRGYATAGFVGNWTLKPELSGLDEHFSAYEALLDRKRWFGLAKSESTAGDLSSAALDWLDGHVEDGADRPFLLWVHYVEPHAPYRLRKEYLPQLGIKAGGTFFSARKRYASEIAYVDERIAEFLEGVGERVDLDDTLVVFVADHGESLGEHGYWGHGRHIYDVTLRVPMAFVWPGGLGPSRIDEPASILDIGPTVLGLAGLPVPGHFRGVDWSPVLRGETQPAADRVTWHQAHRASVEPKEDIEGLRERGLLEVGRVFEDRKEVLRVVNGRRREFDLSADPGETKNLSPLSKMASPELLTWLSEVKKGLAAADELPPPTLTEDDVEALKALGYID